ncbi:class II aldolase/adducin family protein (plasmid) [Bradyrhizobium guangxiense]
MIIQGSAKRIADKAVTQEERRLREDLAALYHIFHLNGWYEHIYNHITARVPGPERHFLINSFGLRYSEVAASNLIKIDIDGKKVDSAEGRVNVAGFTIHSSIHGAREDAHFIAHTHTTAGVAVACSEEGLSPHNFYGAMLHGQIAYHDFEGISTDDNERPRLVSSLGSKNFLILRHHGLLTLGRTAAACLFRMMMLQRACEIQMAAAVFSHGLRHIPEAVLVKTAQQMEAEVGKGFDEAISLGQDSFDAYRRALDRLASCYRD